MITNKVTIYEFSDGIKYEYINGELIFRGLEFGFMNSTLNFIPTEIENAINNGYFKVKSSQDNPQQPALVARVVENWSVIAVVSQIRDDGGRWCEVSRYFLVEENNSLWKIVDYLEQFKSKKGQYPIFNPEFVLKQAPSYSLTTDKAPVFPPFSPDVYSYLQTNKNLIELNECPYTLQQINFLAFSVANNSSHAWAYNISSLEKPHNFDLIIASDSSAFSDISLALNAPKIAPVPVSYSFDESAVKSAMKELISNSFASRYLTTMNDAIQNSSITEENWHQIFNTERANRAVKEQIKGERIARLLTLRALILPETLVDLLKWLEIDGNEKCWDDYLQFSKKFYNSPELMEGARTIIKDNIKEGVYGLLFHILNRDIKPKTVADFLKKDKVNKLIISLRKDIKKDIQLIGDGVAILDDESLIFGLKVWEKLAKDRKENHTLPWKGVDTRKGVYTIEFYKPFVELFDYLDEPKLYSYFAQVSLGEVPISKKLFYDLFQRNSEATLKLYRRITGQEKLVNVVFSCLSYSWEIPVWYLFVFFVWFVSIGELYQPFSKLENVCLPILCDMNVRNFDNKTVASLEQLVTDKYSQEEIKKAICSNDQNKNNCVTKLKWESPIKNIDDSAKKEWFKKIKNYQGSVIENEKGYIGEDTKSKIMSDILESRNKESQRREKALTAFDKRTKVALDTLINDPDVTAKYTNEKANIIDKLKNILGNEELNNDVILGDNNDEKEKEKEKEKWIIAIGEYQKNQMNNPSPDGIIDNPGGTFDKLKGELLKESAPTPKPSP